jgi:hypothetical protein
MGNSKVVNNIKSTAEAALLSRDVNLLEEDKDSAPEDTLVPIQLVLNPEEILAALIESLINYDGEGIINASFDDIVFLIAEQTGLPKNYKYSRDNYVIIFKALVELHDAGVIKLDLPFVIFHSGLPTIKDKLEKISSKKTQKKIKINK